MSSSRQFIRAANRGRCRPLCGGLFCLALVGELFCIRKFANVVPAEAKEPAVIDQKGCMYEPHVVAMAVERAKSLGARTTVSSVHFHITLDQHDKATGTLNVLRTQFGLDTTRVRMRFGFIGDSGNDAPCFAAFPTSIAVSNMSGRPSVTPRFITRGARGAGFVEAARRILAARG